jgi:cytochrome oxidase assembly protein ShyY1
MYRFLARPKWIVFTLVVAAAVVAMVALSLWQLRRLDERREFNAAVTARVDAPAVALDDPSRLTIDDEWTSVLVTGAYDGTAQLEPAAGAFRVIGRIVLADGGTLLVERGSVPSTAELAPPPPSGTVQIVGRVRRVPSSFDVPTSVSGQPDVLVQVISSEPTDDPSLTPAPLPDVTDEGSHLSYAVQWLIFAICAAAGWVIAVRRSAHSQQLTDAGAAPLRRGKHQAVPWRD